MSSPFSRLSHRDEKTHERDLKDVGEQVGEEAVHAKDALRSARVREEGESEETNRSMES